MTIPTFEKYLECYKTLDKLGESLFESIKDSPENFKNSSVFRISLENIENNIDLLKMDLAKFKLNPASKINCHLFITDKISDLNDTIVYLEDYKIRIQSYIKYFNIHNSRFYETDPESYI